MSLIPPTVPSTARLAQSAERKALNLVVVGSSPTVGAFVSLHIPLHRSPFVVIASPSSSGWPVDKMTPVGFEPTQLSLVELESTPLDHSGKVS